MRRRKNGKRNELEAYLKERGVPSMIYYPLPIHAQKAFHNLGYKAGDFPVAEGLCDNVISLPIHTEMDKEQQQYIVETVKSFFAAK